MSKDNENGFVLVEAIAALAVAVFAATALMTALGSVSARSAEARVRDMALRQAEMLLLETLSLTEEDTPALSGTAVDAGLLWTRTLDTAGADYPGLQRIVIEVAWHSLQKEGKTRLEAYRIAPIER